MTGRTASASSASPPAWRDGLTTVARLLLGGLFVYAAVTKIADMASFAEEVADYQLLPAALVPWVAAVMPGIEVAAGLLLVVGVWARPSALVLSGLLAVFIGALSQSLLRGINLKCGCFGGSDEATWGTVWRDVAMLGLSAIVLWLGPGRIRLPLPAAEPGDPPAGSPGSQER